MLPEKFCGWIVFSNMQASFNKELAPQFRLGFKLLVAVDVCFCFTVYRFCHVFAIWGTEICWIFFVCFPYWKNLLKIILSFCSAPEQTSSKHLLCHVFAVVICRYLMVRSLPKGRCLWSYNTVPSQLPFQYVLVRTLLFVAPSSWRQFV